MAMSCRGVNNHVKICKPDHPHPHPHLKLADKLVDDDHEAVIELLDAKGPNQPTQRSQLGRIRVVLGLDVERGLGQQTPAAGVEREEEEGETD